MKRVRTVEVEAGNETGLGGGVGWCLWNIDAVAMKKGRSARSIGGCDGGDSRFGGDLSGCSRVGGAVVEATCLAKADTKLLLMKNATE